MKFLTGLLLVSFLIFAGSVSYAENYAIVTIKKSLKQYSATEFGYRKNSNDIIVYHAKPTNGVFFQGSDDIDIKTQIGTLKLYDEKRISIDADDVNNKIFITYYNDAIIIEGNINIKKGNRKIEDVYNLISFPVSSVKANIESFGDSTVPVISIERNGIIVESKKKYFINVVDNNVEIKKGSYSISITFDKDSVYCWIS